MSSVEATAGQVTPARLSGSRVNPWLAAGRAAWIGVALLTIYLLLAGLPFRLEQLGESAEGIKLSLEQLGLTPGAYAGYSAALDLFVVLAHVVTATVIFLRCKADQKTALLLAYSLVTNGALIPLARMYGSAEISPLWAGLVNLVLSIGLVTAAGLLYLFPDGRFVPRWTLPLTILWSAIALYATFLPSAPLSMPRWPVWLQFLALLALAGTGIGAQIYRYTTISTPLQRQQTKWAVLGLMAAAVGPIAYFLPFVILSGADQPEGPNFLRQLMGPAVFSFTVVFRIVSQAGFSLVLLVFPISFAIAILRYRLWDIDVIINRTLVYSAFTGSLALVYFFSVIVLESVFRAITGQERSVIVTVISTLAIAALFGPLRRSVQSGIDRRFYRQKYDAARTLSAFGLTVRDETDLGRLSDKLLGVVVETMQPAHASLWIRESNATAQASRKTTV